jgi:class 3 adenylate cyclase
VSSVSALPASVDELLKEHPWPAAWVHERRTVEHFWALEVAMPKRALWPHLSDTSDFNHRLGLAPMTFVECDGRVFGSQTRGGTVMEWEEIPWEWEYERGIQNTRVYSKGPIERLRARFMVTDLGADRCKVLLYFGGVPRSLFGRLVLRFGLRSLGRDFQRVFDQLAAAWQAKTEAPRASAPPSLSVESQHRLYNACKRMQADGVAKELVRKLEHFIVTSSDEELSRIRVRELARRWSLPETSVIVAFLHGTRRGLFSLSWDAVCPHCRGARQSLAHLGELPKTASCEPCGIDFDATQTQSLEVNFALHPAIRPIEKVLYCAAEPAKKPHILAQRTVSAGARTRVEVALTEGHYRLRTRGSKRYTLLDVEQGGDRSSIDYRDDEQANTVALAPGAMVTLVNSSERPMTFVLEQRDVDLSALRPHALFALQAFRDVFPQEAIAADVQLDIGQQTILFTDIVGSTRLYEQVGDGAAFYAVRRHFLKTYDVVRMHGGVVVKTIGDAVMGAFPDPAGALRAAIELQRHFDGSRSDAAIRMRISIHTGPCLAVNLNTNIDYFGATVNLAAKLQGIAESGEVSFSDVVFGDPAVQRTLVEEELPVEVVRFATKWSGGSITAHRINVSGPPRTEAPSAAQP